MVYILPSWQATQKWNQWNQCSQTRTDSSSNKLPDTVILKVTEICRWINALLYHSSGIGHPSRKPNESHSQNQAYSQIEIDPDNQFHSTVYKLYLPELLSKKSIFPSHKQSSRRVSLELALHLPFLVLFALRKKH